MSDNETGPTQARLEQFRDEVNGLRVSGGKASPERTWSLIGAVLLGLGLAVALLSALAQRGDTTGSDATTILNEIVLREMGFEQMRPLIYGLLMICSVLFLPNGLESVVQKVLARKRRNHAAAAGEEQA